MSTVSAARPTTAPSAYANYGRPAWRRVLFSREMAIIALLALVVVVASAIVPKFATPITLGYMLFDVTPILLISLAMAPVMITGDIDLSVGSMVGLSSVLVGLLHADGVSRGSSPSWSARSGDCSTASW